MGQNSGRFLNASGIVFFPEFRGGLGDEKQS